MADPLPTPGRLTCLSTFTGLGGMDLGLYLSHRLIDMHNGQIEAEQVPGGVQFAILLPPPEESLSR